MGWGNIIYSAGMSVGNFFFFLINKIMADKLRWLTRQTVESGEKKNMQHVRQLQIVNKCIHIL